MSDVLCGPTVYQTLFQKFIQFKFINYMACVSLNLDLYIYIYIYIYIYCNYMHEQNQFKKIIISKPESIKNMQHN